MGFKKRQRHDAHEYSVKILGVLSKSKSEPVIAGAVRGFKQTGQLIFLWLRPLFRLRAIALALRVGLAFAAAH